jgi:DNA (cytosine-5)-methyltransferase 1
MYNVLDLFSGIGGFSLGLTRAGFNTIAFCEIDKYCRSILKNHWPDVPIFEDIKSMSSKDINGTIDVITGGFPCQPFSVSGKRRGYADDRFLWPEMFRIIQESHPRWVICENVPGIINMALDTVLDDLEGESYETETFIIPACSVNAPHRRDRVWIVAHSIGQRFKKRIASSIPDKTGHFAGTDFKRITASEWITQPGICHRNDGVSGRVARLKALGNSVVPYIPEIIGMFIKEYEKTKKEIK